MDGRQHSRSVRAIDVLASRRSVVMAATGGTVGGLLTAFSVGRVQGEVRSTHALGSTPEAEATPPAQGFEHVDFNLLEDRTNSVGLFISGQRPKPKTGPEILEIARSAQFFMEGRFEVREAAGSTEFVPRMFVRDSIAEALATGRLVSMFTVTGTPSRRPQLAPGTYYVWVDFVDGRWIGRYIDGGGNVACLVPGVEVKQVFFFGEHLPELHNRPQAFSHGLNAEIAVGRAASDSDSDWQVVIGEWQEIPGSGCHADAYCIPGGT
jgi:hypothetical protein